MRGYIVIAGARPNFMKVASLFDAAKQRGLQEIFQLLDAGQHTDHSMRGRFYSEFGLPPPIFTVPSNVGSENAPSSTPRIMSGLFEALKGLRKDYELIVVGDVDTTFAASFVGRRLGFKIHHIEAGLRSFDRTMPEEINRTFADFCSDFHYCTEQSAIDNLVREGLYGEHSTFLVGNVMIDNLIRTLGSLNSVTRTNDTEQLLVTLHRRELIYRPEAISLVITALNMLSTRYKIKWILHPHTRKILNLDSVGFHLIDPLSHSGIVTEMIKSCAVITDSGGLSEETSYLGVPCFTLRNNTERPVTVSHGTNTLVKEENFSSLAEIVFNGLNRMSKSSSLRQKIDIPLWDGFAGARIVDILSRRINND